MIEIENLKESFLEQVQWTENSLMAYLRPKLLFLGNEGIDWMFCPAWMPDIRPTVNLALRLQLKNKQQAMELRWLIDILWEIDIHVICGEIDLGRRAHSYYMIYASFLRPIPEIVLSPQKLYSVL
jgi:hypothetical protein